MRLSVFYPPRWRGGGRGLILVDPYRREHKYYFTPIVPWLIGAEKFPEPFLYTSP